MDYKNMKDKLVKLPYLKLEMKNILNEIREIRLSQDDLRNYSSVSLNGMPKGKRYDDQTALKVSKIIDDYEKRIKEDLLPELERVQHEIYKIKRVIVQLSGKEYFLINARYIEERPWKYIERELHYGRASVFRINRNAIKRLAELWDKID